MSYVEVILRARVVIDGEPSEVFEWTLAAHVDHGPDTPRYVDDEVADLAADLAGQTRGQVEARLSGRPA